MNVPALYGATIRQILSRAPAAAVQRAAATRHRIIPALIVDCFFAVTGAQPD